MKDTTPHPYTTPVENFAAWTIRNRWLILILSVIFTLGAGYGAKNIEFLNN